jgi:hypothetical protein
MEVGVRLCGDARAERRNEEEEKNDASTVSGHGGVISTQSQRYAFLSFARGEFVCSGRWGYLSSTCRSLSLSSLK